MRRRRTFIVGLSLLAVAAAIFGSVTFLNSTKKAQTLVFAQQSMLHDLWDTAKKFQLESSSGRTVDVSRDNVTTSEGESYTMLRAVWMDDRATFDRSWAWTQANLQRPSDHLFSWQYGKKADGTYGILVDQGGQNTASDADSDIALALVMAANRWHESSYLVSAKQIIPSIWDQDVVTVNGKPVLVADNREQENTASVIVNPSYFSPYAYKTFAKIDASDDWAGLTDNSYTILDQVLSAPLDKANSAGLVPNWIRIDRTTGAITAVNASNLDTNYGYDAMRTPFRLALDYQWFHDARDKEVLSHMTTLSHNWTSSKSLASVYGHDGQVISATEAPAIYGGDLGYFIVMQPAQATAIYEQKLVNLYNPNGQDWKKTLSYYDDNWAWFGIGLYDHALDNLTGVK